MGAAPIPMSPFGLEVWGTLLVLVPAAALGWVGLGLFRRLVLGPLSADLPLLARSPLRKALDGFALAILLLAAGLFPGALAGHFSPGTAGWQPYLSAGSGGAEPLLLLATLFVQSVLEELAFRAFLLSLLAMALWAAVCTLLGRLRSLPPASAEYGRLRLRTLVAAGLAANATQAWAFAELHRANPHVTALALVNVGLAGAVLGLLLLTDGALWGALSFHYTWNAGLALLGLPVSGFSTGPPPFGLGVTGARPGALTGGAFGPEGSGVATVGFLILVVFLVRRFTRYPSRP